MAISRKAAANYLKSRFSNFADNIGQSSSDDTATGYGPDIDLALRDMDVAEGSLSTGTVDDADRSAYFARLEYHAARRMWLQMAALPDTSIDGRSVRYANVIKALEGIIETAEEEISGSGEFDRGVILTDYIEPEPA